MGPYDVILNRPLLDRILIEEGMDPARMGAIGFRFAVHPKARLSRKNFWFILTHGAAVAGDWWEEGKIASVYTDQHRSLKELSRTLAHEMGHALDQADPPPYAPALKRLWRMFFVFLTAGSAAIFLWNPGFRPTDSPLFTEIPFVVKLFVNLFAWAEFAFLLYFGTWLLAHGIYFRDPAEKSARRWEKKLTSRKDWAGVLALREGSRDAQKG